MRFLFLIAVVFLAPSPAHAANRVSRCVDRIVSYAATFRYPSYNEAQWRAVYLDAELTHDVARGSLAFLHLLDIRGRSIGLPRGERRAVSRLVRYRENPAVIRSFDGDATSVRGPGFLRTVLLWNYLTQATDALGTRLSGRQRASRVASAFLGDAAWSQLPFLWRILPQLPDERVQSYFRFFDAVPEALLQKIVEALDLPYSPFAQEVATYEQSSPAQRARVDYGVGSRLGRVFRPAVMAFALTYLGIHPVLHATQAAFPTSQHKAEDVVSSVLLPERYLYEGARKKGGLTFAGKKVTFLIDAAMWEEFFQGKEETFFRFSHYRDMQQQARSFTIVRFRDRSELLRELNRDRDDDILIIDMHGASDHGGIIAFGGPRGALEDMSQFVREIEDRPLKPGAELVFSICALGDCPPPRRGEPTAEEAWIAIAKKKLDPRGGKAYAATANIFVLLQPPNDFIEAAAQAVSGPTLRAAQNTVLFESQIREQLQKEQGISIPGFRVFDRADGSTRHYQLTPNQGPEFREVPGR